MLKADETGRYPVSMREYEDIRFLFGMSAALDQMEDLKPRLGLIKNGWRDIRMMAATVSRLIEALLKTVPLKKLLAMQSELKRTVCNVSVKGPAGRVDDDLTVVPFDALLHVMDRAIQMDCTFCSKSAKEGKKCKLHKAIETCLQYEMAKNKDNPDACPLAGSAALNRGEVNDNAETGA